MEIEKQCCSLEQAKKLKALGVKQESYFYFIETEIVTKESAIELMQDAFVDTSLKKNRNEEGVSELTYDKEKLKELCVEKFEELKNDNDVCSAFTVAELGEMLSLHGYDEHCYATISDEMAGEKGFTVWDILNEKILFDKVFPTEAEARATFLIHLLESKTITAKEVNERK